MSDKSKKKKDKKPPMTIETGEGVVTLENVEDIATVSETTDGKRSNKQIIGRNRPTEEKLNICVPFDEQVHTTYPKVENKSGEVLKPVEVISFFTTLEARVLKDQPIGIKKKWNRLLSSLFGYRQFSASNEILKLLQLKTLYCFKDRDITLYLTEDCDVKFFDRRFDGGKSDGPVILVASGLRTSELRIRGFNVFMANGVDNLNYVNLEDTVTLLGDFNIATNNNGHLNHVKVPEKTFYNTQGGSFVSRRSVYAGKHFSKADISIEKSILTDCHLFNVGYLTANQCILSNVSINTPSVHVQRVSIIGGSITLKSIYLKNARLTNPSIYSPSSPVSTEHAYGISEIHHPLLPTVMMLVNGRTEASLKIAHIDEALQVDLTSSEHEIAEKLIKWKSEYEKNLLTEIESRELAKLVFSRITVLRMLSNIENSKNKFCFANRANLPLLDNIDNFDDDWDIDEF